MAISYKPLWHLLVEKEMNKEDLKRAANITSNIVSRMSKNAYVNMEQPDSSSQFWEQRPS